jgi:hypothetical protein
LDACQIDAVARFLRHQGITGFSKHGDEIKLAL